MRKGLIYICMLAVAISVSAQEQALTINEYKTRVLEYSQQIKQSAEQRKAMLQAVKAAKTAFFPQIDFSGNYQYRINNYDMGFGGTSMAMEHDSYELQAGVVQPVYSGGNIYNSYKAAQIKNEIAKQSETLTVDNVLYSADVSYWSASAQKEMYDIMCQYVDIIGQFANILTERFDEGAISKTDLLQVQARLKEAELQKISAYKSYRIALQNLNILMGNPPVEEIVISDSIMTYLAMP